jgi:hypothetical protein
MTWYTASLIQTIKLKDGKQDIYPVYEDDILIEANSVEEAFEKADSIGIRVSEIDDHLELNGKPAMMVYMGVRKLIEIHDTLSTADSLKIDKPYSGVEVSYSYLEVDSEEKLNQLVQGKAVVVHLIDLDNRLVPK